MTPVHIEELHDAEPLTIHDIISIFHAEVVDECPPGYSLVWEDDIPWLEPKRGPLNLFRRWRWERRWLAA